MIITIIYIVGYLWFYRYVVGALLSEVGYNPDGVDVFMSMFFGALLTVFWPILVIGRLSYVSWLRWGLDEFKLSTKVFPEPKEIETRHERNRRIEREKSQQESDRRREINTRERELGMELTKW